MKAIVIVILILVSTVHSQWVKQNPLNPERRLTSLDFINGTTGWAASDIGTIIKTTNGFQDWEVQNLPVRVFVNSLDFIDYNTGFVCCDSGKILKTTDGGTSWEFLNSGNFKTLYTIHFVNQNTGLCGGVNYLLRTTNSGTNWNIINFEENKIFYYIYFLNNETGWTSVVIDTILGLRGKAYKSTDAGATWNSSMIAQFIPFAETVFFINETTGWVTYPYNSNKISSTRDGGFNWSHYNTGIGLFSLFFISEDNGFAFGQGLFKTVNGGVNWARYNSFLIGNSMTFGNQYTGFASGSSGTILRTTNQGINWQNISPEIQTSLYNVKFFDQNTGYVTGAGGLIAKTTNGGTNWIRKQPGTIYDINQFFLNPNTGWLAGAEGLIIKTTDGGDNWLQQSSGSSRKITGICFINSNTGWAGGDSTMFLKTTNGGNNWSTLCQLNNNNISKILALDENKLFAIGFHTFIVSTDGGINWAPIIDTLETYTYRDIFFINENTGWVTKDGWGTFIKSTNGGLNWFLVPLNSNIMLNRIQFFNENTGMSVGGHHLFKTTNGGLNWFSKEIVNVGSFSYSDFINQNTGWAVGELGLIYKTTNGGLIPVINISSEVPKQFSLSQNYPNPFNPTTKIKFDIPPSKGARGMTVSLTIYDILGREVAVLVNEELNPGVYEVEWDGSIYPSGVYFYKLTVTDASAPLSIKYSVSKKMVLLK